MLVRGRRGRRVGRVADSVPVGERRLRLHAMGSGEVAVVQSELRKGAIQEENAIVVATDGEPIESIATDALAGRLAVSIDVDL